MIVDVSSNNGEVKFSQLKDQVSEVFIRSSLGYGDFDKKLSHNAFAAQAAGIPVSYYHFAYPHGDAEPVADAAKQANYFIDTLINLPAATNLAIDLENFNAKGGDTTLSQNQYATWLQSFLDTVESRTGKKCIIYTYADYLNRHLPKDHSFGQYPLWIANYGARLNHPPLPNGWKKSWGWQYSEKGTLPGIAGFVDLTRITKDA